MEDFISSTDAGVELSIAIILVIYGLCLSTTRIDKHINRLERKGIIITRSVLRFAYLSSGILLLALSLRTFLHPPFYENGMLRIHIWGKVSSDDWINIRALLCSISIMLLIAYGLHKKDGENS